MAYPSPCPGALQRQPVGATGYGAKTPKGIASPHFKHGRYSNFLPGGLAYAYEQSRTDPELLNMTDSVALLQARLHELLAGLQPEILHNLQVTKDWRRFRREQKRRVAMSGLMRTDRVQAFARDLLLIVREETPPATWQRVQTRVGELLGAAPYSTVVEAEQADC